MGFSSLAPTLLAALLLHGAPVNLPDPLVRTNGQKVESAKVWREKRRPEILELFRKNVYGRPSVNRPKSLRFKTISTENVLDGTAIRKKIEIAYQTTKGKGSFEVNLCLPSKAKQTVPCFLFIADQRRDNSEPARDVRLAGQLIPRGYAVAVFQASDLAPDEKDNYDKGVFALFDPPGPRAADAWGTIAAWSWGASRVMDYLQTDKAIDRHKIAVVGHSRRGKTALWTGAQDERFALTISNNSGSTGIAVARGKQGERIKDINTSFPHWFNQNYKAYNDREAALPVDQHMLAALIAPRLLYIASASQDEWADPEAEFTSGVAANPVYKLFGLQGINQTTLPPVNVPLHDGYIGYHLREGRHSLLQSDWNQFMDFADKHWEKPNAIN